jgi:hypothetical protein
MRAGELIMTEDEIEAVAAELARTGGLSWHNGQERGPLKLVMNRYRDRARAALAALERVQAAKQALAPDPDRVEQPGSNTDAKPGPVPDEEISDEEVSIGSLVLYHPPGDQRTYPCRVQKVHGSRVYLVPEIPACTGWVDLASLSTPAIQ